MLAAHDLVKNYGPHRVLDGVSLALKPGELTALIGPSGSGKTTLLRALAGLEKPDQGIIQLGEARFDGAVVAPEGVDWPYTGTAAATSPAATPPFWPQVTVVFQQLFLWPHLTLRENILLPARNLQGRDHNAALAHWVKKLDMAEFIDRYPNEASGGQKQRVAIARALMLRPQFLLLDEITSALDVQQTARILEFLPELKAHGMGILLITHALNFARQAADQVAYIEGGKILEAGPAMLLNKPKTAALKKFMQDAALAS